MVLGRYRIKTCVTFSPPKWAMFRGYHYVSSLPIMLETARATTSGRDRLQSGVAAFCLWQKYPRVRREQLGHKSYEHAGPRVRIN